ncbi:MAG: HD domain-containing protein [Firmicutes bacterium]|nr:HD domain-containing protein [Bacillota bacterium]
MNKQFIKDLKVGNAVNSQFVVLNIREYPFSSPARSGESFLILQLGDISGTIKGVIWERALIKDPIYPNDVLQIKGEVGEYDGPQLVIRNFKKMKLEEVHRENFQAVSPRNREKMWDMLLNLVDQNVKEENLRELLKVFFSDEELVEKFKISPAAKIIHHNYLGGLLEHTLEVVEICLQATKLYPSELDRSLLVTAAILHDIGKVEEYDSQSFIFEQTDKGRLLGHITIGLEILRGLLAKVPQFPENIKIQLEHALISHHGEKEWGSPEIPKTFESFTLFHADLFSARLKQFQQIMTDEKGSASWTSWDRFLKRKIYTGFDS